jgi:hypothetical protein
MQKLLFAFMPPLGMFKGLEYPYASVESIKNMDKIWEELEKERNDWAIGIEHSVVRQ